jgi:hypothetical protein
MVPGHDRHGDAPIVYVAKGSHANYFPPTTLPARPNVPGVCKRGVGRTICLVGNDYLTEPVFTLEPATSRPTTGRTTSPTVRAETYDLVPYPGNAFSGAYGPGNYLPTPSWGAGRWLNGLGPFAPQCKTEFVSPVTALAKADHDLPTK